MSQVYTAVFGGANIYPSEISYSAIELDADVTLSWPEETSTSENLVTRIINVTPTGSGFSIIMPPANKAGTGETVLFNNLGADTFTVKDADGIQIVAPTSGTLWQIYITDNSTEAGLWSTLQYGASVSQANASALAGNGLIAIGTLLAQSAPVTVFNSDYDAGDNDRAKTFVWTGAGGTFGLTDPASLSADWFAMLRNEGTGAIVADPDGTSTINGSGTLSFQPGDSAIIVTDGVDYYTVGFGQSATFAFDYTSIAVAGTGNYTLAGSELNRIAYNFTGILTGNRVIIVPATVQQYWVSNQTTGAYSLTVKTAAGTGVAVTQGQRAILYSDGTNVVDADSSTVSIPVAVNQGGTGSTTAGGALINLGGTSVGIALFTAADANAAWSALGNQPFLSGGTF